MYMDETGHISNKPCSNILQWGNKGGEGEGEVEIIHNMCIYMHTRVTTFTCLNETKKGGETSKLKILRILKRGI